MKLVHNGVLDVIQRSLRGRLLPLWPSFCIHSCAICAPNRQIQFSRARYAFGRQPRAGVSRRQRLGAPHARRLLGSTAELSIVKLLTLLFCCRCGSAPGPLAVTSQHTQPMVRCVSGEGPLEQQWGSQPLILKSQPLNGSHVQQQMHGYPYSALPTPHHGAPAFQQHYTAPFTNTLVREAVPDNPKAAHCSLQTDLCGAMWPLQQPFPFPPLMQPPTYALVSHPHAWDRNMAPMRTSDNLHASYEQAPGSRALQPPAATLTDSSIPTASKSQVSSQTGVMQSMHAHLASTHSLEPAGHLLSTGTTSTNQVPHQQLMDKGMAQLSHQPHPAALAVHSDYPSGPVTQVCWQPC
jgi:hypothetical protein